MNITEQTGETVRSFFGVMKENPLSLALVVSNFLLIAFIFYAGSQRDDQRTRVTDLIVQWQREADTLMASCVSSDIMKLVLDALERSKATPPTPPAKPMNFEPAPFPLHGSAGVPQ